MEENQGHIQEGWKLERIGALCKIKKGVQFNKIELSNFGMYPCVNGGIEPSGYSDLWNTSENTITISEGGNSCGYVNLITTKFWSGGHCYSLLDLDKELNNNFLYQALKGRQHLIMDLRVGSGLPNIQQKALKEFEILIPKDKAEQVQISTILSKVDDAISQTEALIAKYTRIKTGLMQYLLTKGMDEYGNIRSEETHEFKDSPLGRIPKEWECEMLGNIFDLKTGITPLRSNSLFFAHEGYNWMKTLDLNEGDLYESEEKITDYALNKTAIKLRPVGTILIAMYGGWQQIGRTSILKSEAATNQAITALVNPRVEMYSEFLQLFLQQNRWRWKQYAVSTRKDPNITKNDIAKFYVLFPKDIVEQKLVAGKILRAKVLSNQYLQKLSKLQSLKTGLMQDLLSGKVRVDHFIKETESV